MEIGVEIERDTSKLRHVLRNDITQFVFPRDETVILYEKSRNDI